MSTERILQNAFLSGQLTRKQFVTQALSSGLSIAGVGSFLATQDAAASNIPDHTLINALAQDPPMAASQDLVMNNDVDPLSLDPLQTTATASLHVMSLIHDGVGRLDPDLNIQPHLAESWEVSEDGTVYTYTFRQGVVSHTGDPFTADDVIFTLDRNLGDVLPENQLRPKIEMIDTYRKIDDFTVEITLQYPFAPFASAFGSIYIYPKNAVEQVSLEEYGVNPVGFGPFRFVEWRPNDYVRLERFEDYWLTQPNLETVDIRPIPEASVAAANLLSGDLDVVTNVIGPILQQLQTADEVEVLSEPGLEYVYAGFRMLDAPFMDQRFREAVYMSTDFDGLVGAILPPELGERAYGTLPRALWPRDEAFLEQLRSIAPSQDQDRSRALFQELIDEGVMDEDYVIRVAVRTDPITQPIAEAMVTSLNEVGANAEFSLVENAVYTDDILRSEESLIFFSGTTADYPDPDDNVRWLFGSSGHTQGFINLTHFEQNPEWQEKIDAATRSQDREERAALYRDVVSTLMSLYVHIPLVTTNVVVGKRNYVQELNVNPVSQWDLVTPWANVYISE